MSDSTSNLTPLYPARALIRRLLNLLAAPGEVLDEVVTAPWHSSNWTAPTLLVCLTGIAFGLRAAAGGGVPQLPGEGATVEAHFMAGAWPVAASAVVCVGAFGGSLWAAFVLWCMGRFFLKARFPFLKALEIAGLAGMILVLGTIVTALLAAATGNPGARPALSLFAPELGAHSTLHKLLELFDLFQLWSAAVLAAGLSRLAGVSFKEAAFWVFGYWVFVRVALVISV